MTKRTVLLVILVAACRFDLPAGVRADSGVDASLDAAKPPPDADPQAWLQPWGRRKSITLLASQIEAPSDGSLADFPVLVSISDPEIRTGALASGQDIVFTAGDATTLLASEIESFSSAVSDQLVAWVKVPMLSATTDTTLYVYYGNQSPPARTPETVWTANYLAVWHLHQDPGSGGAGDIKDATSGNHDGTADAGMSSTDLVQAKIGRGLRFNGSSDFLNFGAMSFGNAFTISMWADFTGTSTKSLMANSAVGLDTNGFRFYVNTFATTDRRIIFETGNGNTNSGATAQTNMNAITADVQTHVAVVVDRTARTAQIFVNGVSSAIATSTASNFQNDSDFEIARTEDGGLLFQGILDEVRVSSVLRSPEWLLTSFRNQSQPGTFHTLGVEELRP